MSLENMSMETKDEIVLLSEKLAKDPATREQFLRMVKKVKPDTSIPEIDLFDKTRDAFKIQSEQILSLENKIKEKEFSDSVQSKRMGLIRDGVVKDEKELAEVEKLMLERGIVEHKTAAEFFKMSKDSSVPTSSAYSPNSMPDDFMKKRNASLSDLNSHARNVAHQAMDDVIKQRRFGS